LPGGKKSSINTDEQVFQCPFCKADTRAGATTCFRCGQRLDSSEPAKNEVKQDKHENAHHVLQDGPREDPVSPSSSTKFLLGFLGSILLFIGVFMPIVSVPILGNLNYFQNGKGDGAIIIILAAGSLAVTLARKYRRLLYTGIASLLILGCGFIKFHLAISEARTSIETELAGNPFSGLGQLAIDRVQLEWGWALLVVGAILLIGAAVTREQ